MSSGERDQKMLATGVLASAVAQHFERQRIDEDRESLAAERRAIQEERAALERDRAALEKDRAALAAFLSAASRKELQPQRPAQLPPPTTTGATTAAASATAAATAIPSVINLTQSAPTVSVPQRSATPTTTTTTTTTTTAAGSTAAGGGASSPLSGSRKQHFWERKKGDKNLVSGPFEVQHKMHVDHDYNWTNVGDPEDIFIKISKLGQGSYGSVFHEMGTEFAAKVLPVSTDSESLQKEIKVLRVCRSPHIVSYYGTLMHSNSIWVLMDFMSLGSLRDAMETCGRGLNEREIAVVMEGALDGLAYLHEHGIMHLDVKAANILLNDELQVKLADFGVSEQVHHLNSDTTVQNLIGTPFWIAPEIVLKRGHTDKADVWSLGITAIELAERNPPGFSMNPYRYMQMVPNRPSPELQEPASWSTEFADFLAKCLAVDPTKRPPCTELRQHGFVSRAKDQCAQVLRPLADEISAAKEKKHSVLSGSISAAMVPHRLQVVPRSEARSPAIPKSVDDSSDGSLSPGLRCAAATTVPPSVQRKPVDATSGNISDVEIDGDGDSDDGNGFGTVVVKSGDEGEPSPRPEALPEPRGTTPPILLAPRKSEDAARPLVIGQRPQRSPILRRSSSVDSGMVMSLHRAAPRGTGSVTRTPSSMSIANSFDSRASTPEQQGTGCFGGGSSSQPKASPRGAASPPQPQRPKTRLFDIILGRSSKSKDSISVNLPAASPMPTVAATEKKHRSSILSPRSGRRSSSRSDASAPTSPLISSHSANDVPAAPLDDIAPAAAAVSYQSVMAAVVPLKAVLEELQKDVASLRVQVTELEERTRPDKIRRTFKAVVDRELVGFKGTVLERIDERVASGISRAEPQQGQRLKDAAPAPASPPAASPPASAVDKPVTVQAVALAPEGRVQKALLKFGQLSSSAMASHPVRRPSNSSSLTAASAAAGALQRQEAALVRQPQLQSPPAASPAPQTAAAVPPLALSQIPYSPGGMPTSADRQTLSSYRDFTTSAIRQKLLGSRRMYMSVVPTTHDLLRMELLSEIGELAAKLTKAMDDCSQASAKAAAQLRKEACANAAAIRADALAAVSRHSNELHSRIVEGLADRVGEALRKRDTDRTALIRKTVKEAVREEIKTIFKRMLS